MQSARAAHRDYLSKLIVRSLTTEIGPTLAPGRERLILDTACALIRDLAQGDDTDISLLPAELLNEATALRGEIPGTGLAAISAAVDSAATAPETRVRAGSYLRKIADQLDARLASAPSLRSAYELSARGSLATDAAANATPHAALQRYLSESPLTQGAASVSVRRLSSGMSKETYAAEFESVTGAKRRLIVRKDSAFSCMQTSVIDEYPLLKMLRKAGLKVPDALDCESDPGVCGAPFMVMEAVAGVSDPSLWADDVKMRGAARQLLEFLAQLHALPLGSLRAAPPTWLDPNHMCRSVQGLRLAWQRCAFTDEPLMDAVLAWLEANQPRRSEDLVLVHADAGFHNVLLNDGKLCAVLDWETCHLGYPEEDLLTVKPFLERLMPWAEVLAVYRANGGRCDDRLHPKFYTTFVLGRIAVSLFNIRAAMRDGNTAVDARDAYIATRYTQRLVAEAFKTMAAREDNDAAAQ